MAGNGSDLTGGARRARASSRDSLSRRSFLRRAALATGAAAAAPLAAGALSAGAPAPGPAPTAKERSPMQYRTLGRTALRVSEIGFGGVPIHDPHVVPYAPDH